MLIPDVSEFQTVDFDVFSGPIIVRAHNSSRADKHWAAHAAGASRQPWWAAYQYLTKNADPAQAARAFLATLGAWRPNCTIVDIEEGDGDQQARQHAWLTVMADDPARDWTYSGDYFARTHGLTVDWIAAYQSRKPTAAHTLWQFTDAHDFPGIGRCDGSVFHGTVDELTALTGGTAPTTPTPSEDDMIAASFVIFSDDDIGKAQGPVYLAGRVGGVAHVDNFAHARDVAHRHGITVVPPPDDGKQQVTDGNGNTEWVWIVKKADAPLFGMIA